MWVEAIFGLKIDIEKSELILVEKVGNLEVYFGLSSVEASSHVFGPSQGHIPFKLVIE